MRQVSVDTTSGDPKRICLNPSANRVSAVLENVLYPNVLTSRAKQAAAAHIFLLSLRRRLVYVCMYVCMYVCIYVCMYVYAYVCIYVCLYVCMYVYAYVCIYVRIYVCMYVSRI